MRTLQARTDDTSVIFAIIREQDEATQALAILQSFAYQLVLENPHLQPVLHSAFQGDRRRLKQSVKFVTNLVEDLAKSIGHVFFLIDGLDECELTERGILLNAMKSLLKPCPNLKILISCRNEVDIAKLLKDVAEVLPMSDENRQDIDAYVESAIPGLLSTFAIDASTAIASEIQALLRPLASNAKG
jgi:hypothetical protein